MELGKGLAQAFVFVAVIVALLTGSVGYAVHWLISIKGLESKKLITPEIKLTIKDNRVDTVYVYKKSK